MKNCTSSNKSVATVTNKGKITAKKNGTTTIKVKLTSGKTLSCKVTVVGNSFKAAKADMLSTVGNRTSKIYGVVFFFRLIYTGQHTDAPFLCLKSAIIVCDFLNYCNIVNKNVTKL